ncbi:MAG: helix-turn-helix transcriptional regulator [Oligoflexia bacterium]|nr:helix-turn-helix transcriptional regulator [Oligoflexia bacterium]
MKNQLGDLLNEIDPQEPTPGKLIRAIRKNFNLTLKEIQSLTGILEPNLSAIENDRMELTKKTAELIGAALGVHPSTLLFPSGCKKTNEIKLIEKKSQALREKKKKAVGF